MKPHLRAIILSSGPLYWSLYRGRRGTVPIVSHLRVRAISNYVKQRK
jgi:hypothetical protein